MSRPTTPEQRANRARITARGPRMPGAEPVASVPAARRRVEDWADEIGAVVAALRAAPAPEGETPRPRERELCRRCEGNGVVKIPGGVSVCPRCHQDCYEPAVQASIGADPACPCQDGDVCHYVDTETTKAMPIPECAEPAQWPLTGPREVKLGVIEFHSPNVNPGLMERFYAVRDDLTAAGAIVDLWLMDIQTVLAEHGYQMRVFTDKPMPTPQNAAQVQAAKVQPIAAPTPTTWKAEVNPWGWRP
jgi:hypothetical protein